MRPTIVTKRGQRIEPKNPHDAANKIIQALGLKRDNPKKKGQ